MAPAGSVFQSAENALFVMPETRAKSSSALLPVSTATCIWIMALLNAVPPPSASNPTEESAVANPRICGCVSPTCEPAEARRVDMSRICDSVGGEVVAEIDKRGAEIAELASGHVRHVG
jgi:hypothetical protein